MSRRRADIVLVERGYFASRARAQAAIEAGLVRADGKLVGKASETIPTEAAVEAEAPHPYVSRGGVKLAAALDEAGIDPAGLVCLDVGASTGGFTDVLLRRGARRVYAVDVGHGQLDAALAVDPRVASLERQDARTLSAEQVPDAVQLLVMDVSFISVRLVLPAVMTFLSRGAQVVVLVKPQFEAGRSAIGRGGIVRDEAARDAAVDAVLASARELGLADMRIRPSPITGQDGNVEYLLTARRD